jgi:4-hydroxymandelate oxidase
VAQLNIGDVVSLAEFEAEAGRTLNRMAYEYVASGAGDEITIAWNRKAYDRIALRPRVLRDVGEADIGVRLLGLDLSLPILLGPVPYHRALHSEGELASAKGASAAGALLVVSSGTTATIEDIAKVSTSPLWFQLYVQSDREFTKSVIQRVEAAGVKALCLTVDTPVLGARNRQVRANFRLPLGVNTPYLLDVGKGKQDITNPRRAAVTWTDVDLIRSVCKLPLVLKGIMTPEDAQLAIEHGADAMIVSNHAGRNLDTMPATIDVLPFVVEAVSGRVPVLVDGGIRRGTDVIKAIALGAAAVLIGRPYCYGLAVAGSMGVQRVVEILRQELQMAMTLMGAQRLEELSQSSLWNFTRAESAG